MNSMFFILACVATNSHLFVVLTGVVGLYTEGGKRNNLFNDKDQKLLTCWWIVLLQEVQNNIFQIFNMDQSVHT